MPEKEAEYTIENMKNDLPPSWWRIGSKAVAGRHNSYADMLTALPVENMRLVFTNLKPDTLAELVKCGNGNPAILLVNVDLRINEDFRVDVCDLIRTGASRGSSVMPDVLVGMADAGMDLVSLVLAFISTQIDNGIRDPEEGDLVLVSDLADGWKADMTWTQVYGEEIDSVAVNHWRERDDHQQATMTQPESCTTS